MEKEIDPALHSICEVEVIDNEMLVRVHAPEPMGKREWIKTLMGLVWGMALKEGITPEEYEEVMKNVKLDSAPNITAQA